MCHYIWSHRSALDHIFIYSLNENLKTIYHLTALCKKLIASPQQFGLLNGTGQEKSFLHRCAHVPAAFTRESHSTVYSGIWNLSQEEKGRERKERKKTSVWKQSYEIKTKSFCCVSKRLWNGQQSEVQFSIAYILQR